MYRRTFTPENFFVGVITLAIIATGILSEPTCYGAKNRLESIYAGYKLSWDDLKDVQEPFYGDRDLQVVELGLEECISRTLEHNLDIRVGGYSPAIQMTQVVQAEAAFDAVLFSDAQYQKLDQANLDSGISSRTIKTPAGTEQLPSDPFDKQSDQNYSLGLRKRLATGASIEMAQRLRRFRTDDDGYFRNPFYQYSLDIEIRQPLLKDFGIDINRASIKAARNNARISQQQFNLLVIQTVAEVENNYWQLVFLRQRVRVLTALVEQAERTLERLRERKVLDASSGVIASNRGLIERARADQLTAKNDVLKQQDRLLESINDPGLKVDGSWEIIPKDSPVTVQYNIDRKEALRTGMQMRPELIVQRIGIDTSGIALGVARNQMLPRLDMVARQEVTGPGNEAGQAWNEQKHYDTVNYLLGLSFEVPLGNRGPRAAMARAELELRQEKMRLASFEEQVLVDITVSLHGLESVYQEIDVRQKAVRAEADTLKAYLVQESTDAKITADFLNRKLDAQERLARAQILLAQTIQRYNVSIIDAHRAQGTLLRYNNIKLAESLADTKVDRKPAEID